MYFQVPASDSAQTLLRPKTDPCSISFTVSFQLDAHQFTIISVGCCCSFVCACVKELPSCLPVSSSLDVSALCPASLLKSPSPFPLGGPHSALRISCSACMQTVSGPPCRAARCRKTNWSSWLGQDSSAGAVPAQPTAPLIIMSDSSSEQLK